MSTETLELRLKAFRLPSFLGHYAGLSEQATKGGWSHVHYLDELAGIEAEERTERRIARLFTQSKLPRDKTLATLDMGRFPTPVRTQVARLVEGQFLEGATNLCIFGNPGTGKTHVMAAIGSELVRQGHSVLFTPVSQLVERLLEAKRDLRLTRELRRLDRIDRNGPTNLDSAVSEIFLGFQAANSGAAWPKYTASGVRRSSALCRRLAL